MRFPLLTLVLLTPGLAAQTTVSIRSASPISVMTNVAGGNVTFDGIPQNRTIGAWPNHVALSTSQSPAGTGKFLLASTSINPTVAYQGGIGLNFFEHAYCRGDANDFAGSSNSATQSGATLGAHTVLATFSAAPGTVGEIRISLRTNPGTNGTVFATVDVDNDGSNEFAQGTGASVSIPYTIGQSGQVTVRVGNECNVSGLGVSTYNRAYSEIWVGFMPDLTATCNITSYGQGCGGVQATGSDQVTGPTRTLMAHVTGAFPNDPVIVATGSQQISLPLLGGCSLLCNAENVSLVTANGAGAATESWTLPATTIGTTYIQMLPVTLQNGSLVLKASNGIRAHCFR